MKAMKFQLFVAELACIAALSSCVSGSALQTGRTVGKSNSETNIGFSSVKYAFPVNDVDTISASAPMMELDYRYGVTDRIDVGARLSILGLSGIYGKYRFLGTNESVFAGSVGLNFSALGLSAGSTNGSESFTMMDITVPTWFSVHPTTWLSIYASPRYILRLTDGSPSHWYGSAAGVRFGKRFGGFAEYSLFGSSSAVRSLNQFSVGLSIGF
jgi:hypothetical protein